jgi:anti-anti-sigma factor
MSCEHGPGTGPAGTSRRPAAGMRCRPVAGAVTATALEAGLDTGLETQWRYDIVQVLEPTVVTEVTGEIDLRTGAILRKRLFELIDAGFRFIIIDFDGVRFCDAAGLGVLVAVHNRLRDQGGAISLARVRPAQRRLFDVSGLDRIFALYDSTPDAVLAHQDEPAGRGEEGEQEERPTTTPTG